VSNLLSVVEAQQRLLERFSPLPVERIPLEEAAGRVLAQEIASRLDLPPFPNSSMDGFAVRSADIAAATPEKPQELRVVGDIPAGQAPDMIIQAWQAVRIMTGAPLPDGADAVIPVEDTDFNYRQVGVSAPDSVRVLRPVHLGENVRPRGQDVQAGETVLPAATRLLAQHIGFMAMLGIAYVPVHRLARIGLFSSGDELVPVSAPLTPGKIHDSNSYTLTALVERDGAIPLHLGVAPDDAAAVQATLDRAVSERADLIISSAGVSVGAFDFVRSVVEGNGELNFWRVNMRPGKPLAFGYYREIPFIGLPGNPVSAYVGYEIFVRPVLLKMAGIRGWNRVWQPATLLEAVESDGRESYLRGVVSRQDGRLVARLTGHQGSGNLRSLVQANALLMVPSEVKSLPAGSEINAWLMNEINE